MSEKSPSIALASAPTFTSSGLSPRTSFAKLFLRERLGVVGAVIVLCLVVGAAVGPMLAPNAPDALVGQRLMDPGTSGFILGTDATGRDELSRILNGFRQTVLVAGLASVISVVLAVTIGMLSGWSAGRWPDVVVQRFVDAAMSFPPLVTLIVVAAIVGAGIAQLVVTLGILTSIAASRVVRSAVLSVKDRDYVMAARACGAPTYRLILKHVLPNVAAPIIVIATLNLGNIVLVEASLSFLGLGITDPALPTWGRMLFDARSVLQKAPFLAVWPGVMISLTVFAFNMLGDALRDVLDPRLR